MPTRDNEQRKLPMLDYKAKPMPDTLADREGAHKNVMSVFFKYLSTSRAHGEHRSQDTYVCGCTPGAPYIGVAIPIYGGTPNNGGKPQWHADSATWKARTTAAQPPLGARRALARPTGRL